MGSAKIKAGDAYVAIYGDNKPLQSELKKLTPAVRASGEALSKVGESTAAAFKKGSDEIVEQTGKTKEASDALIIATMNSTNYSLASKNAMRSSATSTLATVAATEKLVQRLDRVAPATKGFASAFRNLETANVGIGTGAFAMKSITQLLQAAGPAAKPLLDGLTGIASESKKVESGLMRDYGALSLLARGAAGVGSLGVGLAKVFTGGDVQLGRLSQAQQVARSSMTMARMFGTKEQKAAAKQMDMEADAASIGAAFSKGWMAGFVRTAQVELPKRMFTPFSILGTAAGAAMGGPLGAALGGSLGLAMPMILRKLQPGAAAKNFVGLLFGRKETAGAAAQLGLVNHAVEKIGASAKGVGEAVGSMSRGMAAGIAGAVAGLSALTAFARDHSQNTRDRTESIGLSSVKTKRSVESTSELAFAAEATGTSLKTLDSAFKGLDETIEKATGDSEGAEKAWNKLAKVGLSASSLAGMNSDQKIAAVGQALQSISDPAERDAAAMDLLGESGHELTEMLGDLNGYKSKAHASGAVVSQKDVDAAKKMSVAMSQLKAVLSNAWNQIGQASIRSTTAWISGATKFIANNQAVLKGLLKIVSGLGAAAGALMLFQKFGIPAVNLISKLGPIVAALASPIGLVALAIGGGVAAWMYFSKSGNAAAQYLSESLGKLGEFFGEVWGGIVGAVSKGDLALAGNIVWTALKLGFFQALDEMNISGSKVLEVMYAAWNVLTDGITNAWAGVSTAFRVVQNQIAKGMIALTGGIAKLWAQVFAGMVTGFNNTHNVIGKGLLYLAGKATGRSDEDIKSDYEGMDQQTNHLNAQAETNRQNALGPELTESMKALDDMATADIAKIEESRKKAIDDHANKLVERMSSLKPDDQRINDLKAELSKMIGQAKQGDEKSGKSPSKLEAPEFASEKQGKAVAGTFSALASRGLGGGNIAAQHMEVTKQVVAAVKEVKEVIAAQGKEAKTPKPWDPSSKKGTFT